MDFPITDSMRKIIASQPLRVNANSTMMAGRSSVSTGAHAVNIAPNVNVAIFNSVDRLTNESKLVFESQITYRSDEEKWSVEHGGRHYTFKDMLSQGYRMDKMESGFMSLRTTTTFVRQEALIKVRNVTIMAEAQPDMVELDAYLENGNCYAIDPIALFMALGVKKHLIINGIDKYGIAVGSQKAIINKLQNGGFILDNVLVSEVRNKFADELGLEFRLSWNGYEKVAILDNKKRLISQEKLEEFFRATNHFQANSVNEAMVDDLNRVLEKYEINTYDRITIFMATVGHESQDALVERYVDNVYVVDGVDYRGGGYTQLTGTDNYHAFAQQMEKEGLIILNHDGSNPITSAGGGAAYIAEHFPWEAAGWHWGSPGITINNRIDKGESFYRISQVINGGPGYSDEPNGWNERQDFLKKAQDIFQ